MIAANKAVDEGLIAAELNEQEILIQSIMESFVPRLISEDLPLLQSLLNDVFPGVRYEPVEIAELKEEIKQLSFGKVQEKTFKTSGNWGQDFGHRLILQLLN